MMGINVDLFHWFRNFLIKKLQVEQLKINISNKELAEELLKPIIRKFKKRKVYSSLLDNIWLLILMICN